MCGSVVCVWFFLWFGVYNCDSLLFSDVYCSYYFVCLTVLVMVLRVNVCDWFDFGFAMLLLGVVLCGLCFVNSGGFVVLFTLWV